MSDDRQLVSSGTAYEKIAGYSRALRYGNQVFVSGTTATDENDNLVGENDIATQGRFILQKIERALNNAGASIKDVVRTRIYITDASLWEPISLVHGEVFGEIRPANTLIEVSALIGDGYLVEIEADAIIGAGDSL